METEQKYIQQWKMIGEKFHYGWRVCKHVTNSYKDKYKDLSYEDAIIKMKRDAQNKIVEINKLHKFMALEWIHRISIDPKDLNTAEKTLRFIDVKTKDIKGLTFKLGYYRSIVLCLNRLRPDQLQFWVKYKFKV